VKFKRRGINKRDSPEKRNTATTSEEKAEVRKRKTEGMKRKLSQEKKKKTASGLTLPNTSKQNFQHGVTSNKQTAAINPRK